MLQSSLGRLLVQHGMLGEEDRQMILKNSGSEPWSFAKGVIAVGLLDEMELTAIIADQTRFELAPKDLLSEFDSHVFEMLDPGIASRLEIFPISYSQTSITVAVPDPLDRETCSKITFFTGKRVNPLVAPLSEIRRCLSEIVQGYKAVPTQFERFLANHAAPALRQLELGRYPHKGRPGRVDQQSAPPSSQALPGHYSSSASDDLFAEVDIGETLSQFDRESEGRGSIDEVDHLIHEGFQRVQPSSAVPPLQTKRQAEDRGSRGETIADEVEERDLEGESTAQDGQQESSEELQDQGPDVSIETNATSDLDDLSLDMDMGEQTLMQDISVLGQEDNDVQEEWESPSESVETPPDLNGVEDFAASDLSQSPDEDLNLDSLIEESSEAPAPATDSSEDIAADQLADDDAPIQDFETSKFSDLDSVVPPGSDSDVALGDSAAVIADQANVTMLDSASEAEDTDETPAHIQAPEPEELEQMGEDSLFAAEWDDTAPGSQHQSATSSAEDDLILDQCDDEMDVASFEADQGTDAGEQPSNLDQNSFGDLNVDVDAQDFAAPSSNEAQLPDTQEHDEPQLADQLEHNAPPARILHGKAVRINQVLMELRFARNDLERAERIQRHLAPSFPLGMLFDCRTGTVEALWGVNDPTSVAQKISVAWAQSGSGTEAFVEALAPVFADQLSSAETVADRCFHDGGQKLLVIYASATDLDEATRKTLSHVTSQLNRTRTHQAI